MKPSLPQGTRDFRGDILRKRTYIIDTIRKHFELYGFQPLETPAMENLETLTGKYGEEGDKLIFKILNNGLHEPAKRNAALQAFENVLQGKNEKEITSRALRYDLTIPFARYVATNLHQLPIPFKRFQIQPVWRADRPQRGRYREFYQCDADIAGTTSLLADAEFALLYRDAFQALRVPVKIKINNRKLLTALAQLVGQADALTPITVAIDKLDKIGIAAVKEQLTAAGVTADAMPVIEKYLSVTGSNQERIGELKKIFKTSPSGMQGIEEIEQVMKLTGDDQAFEFDTTLARGLDYYTGTIYEVKAEQVQMGSIGGGGRYDDLTGLFGVKGVPGVGISFGIDRIYDVMEESGAFPDELATSSSTLFFNMGKEESLTAFRLMQMCRKEGVECELYYESSKLEKQFKYAEKRGVRRVIIIGSREVEQNICKVKELASGTEHTIEMDELPAFLKMEVH